MLRITLSASSPQEAVLKLEGQVAGMDVGLVDQEGQRLLQEAAHLVLDLDGVQFIDEAGVALLKQWVGPRLSLRGGSPFLQALLAGAGLQVEPTD